jgi:hypothetical protein
MVVQFPDEISPNLLKVVVSIEDLKMELLSTMMAKDGQMNFMIMDGQPVPMVCVQIFQPATIVSMVLNLFKGLEMVLLKKFPMMDGVNYWDQVLKGMVVLLISRVHLKIFLCSILSMLKIHGVTTLHLQVVAGTTRCLHFLQISVFLVLLALLGNFN